MSDEQRGSRWRVSTICWRFCNARKGADLQQSALSWLAPRMLKRLCMCGCGQVLGDDDWNITKFTPLAANEGLLDYAPGHHARRTFEIDWQIGCWRWLGSTNSNG